MGVRGLYLRLLIAFVAPAAGCGDGPNDPGSLPVTGTWQGTSTYFNAPFTLVLAQDASNRLSGTYKDTYDEGFVGGQVTGTQVVIDVNFGDTGIRLSGTRTSARVVAGTISGPVIGGTYPFQMIRGR